jgi:predicted acyl esterase
MQWQAFFPQSSLALILSLIFVVAFPQFAASAAFRYRDDPGQSVVKGTSRIYGNDTYPVWYRRNQPLNSPKARYAGYRPSNQTLKAGTVRREGALKLPCDIIFEQDISVKLRDGITIYTDVFRPTTNEKVPSIVAYGSNGKQVGGQTLDDLPNRAGIARSALSELQRFEGPDPAYWVCKGYAVMNVDARGAYHSEGNISFWGRQLAEDGYDFVEWAGTRSWSNGKVGFSGNSHLAVSQWTIAADNPPHLAAIAPWEGFFDDYREAARRGGIDQLSFSEELIQSFAGRNYVEDGPRMQADNALINPYWDDKTARLARIRVPAYVVASYTNPVNTHGSLESFRRIMSKDRWLRVHNNNQWVDCYDPANVDDLRKFFDYYLKDAKNDWHKTPRVRYSVLDLGGKDTVNRPEAEWPVPATQAMLLHLREDKTMNTGVPKSEKRISYSATDNKGVEFVFKAAKTMELLGYSKLKLWVEAAGSNDMELTVRITKRDANNNPLPEKSEINSPAAAVGMLRVSHRELDMQRSTKYEPYQLHKKTDLLKGGEVVPVEIGIWPVAMRFNEGEHIILSITPTIIQPVNPGATFARAIVPIPKDGGTFTPGANVDLIYLGGPEESLPKFVREQGLKTPTSRNKGMHIIHMGGKYDSHLLMPVR